MESGARQRTDATAGECRLCGAVCDKLVDVRGCIEQRCPYLYSYEDRASGRRFMGCMNRVFRAEIDIDLFEEAERGAGYGGIKMTGDPRPQCRFTVERAFEGEGPEFECVNLRFFDCTDQGPQGMRVFDLRNALT